MRHVRTISRNTPRKAQFEPLLQLVSLLTAVVGFISLVSETFGLELPMKSGDEG